MGTLRAPKFGSGQSRGCWTIPAPSGTTAVPTLVLARQACHASSIVDYGPDQSQTARSVTVDSDRLFAIDWLPATDETADWSIEGYVAVSH